MGRRGFTVLELMVAIVVIGILIAILVPAVQSARETARHAHCLSNLAQLGKAIHGYESTHGRLPDNYRNAVGRYRSAHIDLLPWLEQPDLFAQLEPPTLIPGPLYPNHGAIGTVLPIFLCPSDAGPGLNNYVYCVGSMIAATEPPGRGTGAFRIDGKASHRLADIVDGLSNTAGISERLRGSEDLSSFDRRRDIWFSGLEALVKPMSAITPEMLADLCTAVQPAPGDFSGASGRSWAHPTFLGSWYNQVFPPNAPIPPCATHQLSAIQNHAIRGPYRGIFTATSQHRTSVNLMLLDGSVRKVSNDVDVVLWRGTASIADGESIGDY